jgi:hypothetical protein
MTWLAALLELPKFLAFGAFMAAGGWVLHARTEEARIRRLLVRLHADERIR